MTATITTARSRLRVGDVLRVGSLGLRSRRMRTSLSTLGVAIGIAAMVGVLGLSASSQEDLNAKIRALGTNLLEVQAGQGLGRGTGTLPDTAVAMTSRIGPVIAVSSLTTVTATVRRTDTISEGITSGIGVFAADPGLLSTLHATLADGRFFDTASAQFPNVVLGTTAAQKLGVVHVGDGLRVYIAGQLVRRDRHPQPHRSRHRAGPRRNRRPPRRARRTSPARRSRPAPSTSAPRTARSTACAPCCRRR